MTLYMYYYAYKCVYMSAKALYETVLIKSFGPNNPSKIYRYIDKVTGHNSIPISVSYKSTSASSDLEKASLFNNISIPYSHAVLILSLH